MLEKENDHAVRLKKNNPIRKEVWDEPCFWTSNSYLLGYCEGLINDICVYYHFSLIA